jgi:hypothetical protein
MTKIGFQDVFNTSSSVVIIATLLEGFICKGDTLVLNDGNPYMYRNIKIISIEQYRKTLDKFDVIGGQVGLLYHLHFRVDNMMLDNSIGHLILH